MYTPPVPPVTMFSVRPVKSGVAEAAAVPGTVCVGAACRGAAHAAATRSSAPSGAATKRFMSQPPVRGSLGGTRPFQATSAAILRGAHPAPLVVRLGEQGRKRHRPAALVGRDEHEVGRCDVGGLSG